LIRYALLVAVAVSVLVTGYASSALAQVSPTPNATATVTSTPVPTATVQGQFCQPPGMQGGVPIEVVRDVVQVTPPGGGTYDWALLPPSSAESQFRICFIEGNALVFISLDCREIRRVNPGTAANANAVLDAIVDSCEVIAPTPTPQPAATVTVAPTQAPRPVITPPDTGDSGLR
jgi:hypothetical protein